jgi:hypothetical protein
MSFWDFYSAKPQSLYDPRAQKSFRVSEYGAFYHKYFEDMSILDCPEPEDFGVVVHYHRLRRPEAGLPSLNIERRTTESQSVSECNVLRL